MQDLVGHFATCTYLILVYIFRLALRFGFGDFNFLQALACGPDTLCYYFDDGASSFSVIQSLTGEAFSGLGFGVCHGLDNSHTTKHAVSALFGHTSALYLATASLLFTVATQLHYGVRGIPRNTLLYLTTVCCSMQPIVLLISQVL